MLTSVKKMCCYNLTEPKNEWSTLEGGCGGCWKITLMYLFLLDSFIFGKCKFRSRIWEDKDKEYIISALRIKIFLGGKDKLKVQYIMMGMLKKLRNESLKSTQDKHMLRRKMSWNISKIDNISVAFWEKSRRQSELKKKILWSF